MKSKKHFLGVDIKQKEIKGGPHRGPPKDGQPPGDKITEGGGKGTVFFDFPGKIFVCTLFGKNRVSE